MTSIGPTEPAIASTARQRAYQYCHGFNQNRRAASCLPARTTARRTGIVVDPKVALAFKPNSYLLDGCSKHHGQGLSDLLFACQLSDR